MRGLVLVVLSIALGCAPAEIEPSAPQQEPDAAQIVALARPAFEVIVDGAEPRLARDALGEPSGPGTHVDAAGWVSAEVFAYCQRRTGCRECVFRSVGGGSEVVSSGDGCLEPGVEGASLDARLAGLGPAFGDASWPVDGAVTLVVETREAEQTNEGTPRPMFKLGVVPTAGGPASWVGFVDPCEGCGLDQVCTGRAHLDALAPSPDGAQVAALVHIVADDRREELQLQLWTRDRLRQAAIAPASRGR